MDVVPFQCQQVADEIQDLRLVLYDQDAGHAHLQRADPRRPQRGPAVVSGYWMGSGTRTMTRRGAGPSRTTLPRESMAEMPKSLSLTTARVVESMSASPSNLSGLKPSLAR